MLVFLAPNLAFLAVPKTGTTAVEMALRGRADIAFRGRLKHMTAPRFHNRFRPFLEENYGARPEAMAVMRDPIEQIRSWYRYRSRLKAGRHAIRGIGFETFVEAMLSDSPPPFAEIGSQHRFLCGGEAAPMVEHLFAYEAQPRLLDFLSERFGERITLRPRNVSAPVDTPLSAELETRLRAARAREFALHDRLVQAGGYLRPDRPDKPRA